MSQEVDHHVVPVNDLREHVTNSSCWCQPVEDGDCDHLPYRVWIHNSLDRREEYEQGRLFS